MRIMKGLLDFTLFFICVESAILDLREDSSTAVRPSAMAEPTSESFPNIDHDARDWPEVEDRSIETEITTAGKSDSDLPYIKVTSNTTIITSAGQPVYFYCQVENLGDRQVSWIRRSDLKILTIGLILYTKDNRFCPLHESGSNVWILKLTNSQVEDSGDYECQVSYHDDVEKKLKLPFSLTVLNSRAYIHDSPDLYVQKGSRLLLTCIIKESSSPPDFSYWYQNREVLNYKPQVTIDDLTKPTSSSTSTPAPNGIGMDILASRLSIVELTKSHSGNYTCAPSNARPTSINVHVVDDESGPAAMQHGTGSPRVSNGCLLSIVASILASISVASGKANLF